MSKPLTIPVTVSITKFLWVFCDDWTT